MTGKNRVEVKICGKDYTLMGSETEDYLRKIASYINRKMNEIIKMKNNSSTEMTSVLTAVNVADDFFKIYENEIKLKEELAKCNEENEMLRKENFRLIMEKDDVQLIDGNKMLYEENEILKVELELVKIELQEFNNALDTITKRGVS